MIARDAWARIADLPWGPTGDALLAWLLTYGVHSTVLLLLVVALLRHGRPRSLKLRERLLGLGLFGAFVTSSLQVALDLDPWLGRFRLPAAEEAAVAAPALREPSRAMEASHPEPERLAATEPERPLHEARPESRRVAASTGVTRDPGRDRTPWPPRAAGVTGVTAPPPETVAPPPASSRPLRTTSDRSFALASRGIPEEAPTRDELLAERRHRRATTASTAIDATAAAAPSATGSPRVAALAGWIWSLAALLVVASFVLATSRFAFHLRKRLPIVDGPVRRQLDALQRQAGMRRRVRLSHSPRISTPLCFGILRREICLPTRALAELSPAQLQALLGHELAHTLRRDPLRFGASSLLTNLFFFQPLNRSVRRRLLSTAEILCDDQAIRWTGDRVALASCLAQVAGWMVGPMPRPQLAAGMTASRSRLSERIERLLDDRRSPTPEPRHRALTIGLVAVVLGLAWAVPGAAAARPLATVTAELEPAPAPTAAARFAAPGTGFARRASAPAADALPDPRMPRPTALRLPAGGAVPGSVAPVAAVAAMPPEPPALHRLLASSRELSADLGRFELELLETTRLLQSTEIAPAIAERLADIEQRTSRFLEQRARFDELVRRISDTSPPTTTFPDETSSSERTHP